VKLATDKNKEVLDQLLHEFRRFNDVEGEGVVHRDTEAKTPKHKKQLEFLKDGSRKTSRWPMGSTYVGGQ